jgi:phenylacetate-CoA ligase
MRTFSPVEFARLVTRYLRDYPAIAAFPTLSPERIAEAQLVRLRRLVEIAYHGSEFYRRLYASHDIAPEDVRSWADFRRLPTVTKDDLIEHHDLVPVGASAVSRRVRVSYSSGSSGKVLKILAGPDRFITSALMMLRMYRSAYPFSAREDVALLYTSTYPYLNFLNPFRIRYINTLTPPAQMIARLERMRPKLVIAYPSILMELTAAFESRCRALGVRAIATNSEQSTQLQRDMLADVFGCPVFDEYSSEELVLGSFQCAELRYHLQEDCAYLESLKVDSDEPVPPGRVGEIVGTCLVNTVMPFIRYRQGDLAAISPANCSCANNGRIMSDISGRKNSSFRLPDGRVLPSGRVLDWTYKLIIEHRLPIAQFQVIQHQPAWVEVILVGMAGYRHEDSARLVAQSFKEGLGDGIRVEVTQVASIQRTPAGKHLPIRSFVT